jgi:hypothetical protein
MRSSLRYLAFGFGMGAAGLFFLDPSSGHRRRRRIERRVRDMSHRMKGLCSDIAHSFELEVEVDNQTLCDRVRADMGHILRRAQDVEVDVDHGLVTLHGKIWDDEIEILIQGLERVPGVKEVRDFLTIRERQQQEERNGRSSHG